MARNRSPLLPLALLATLSVGAPFAAAAAGDGKAAPAAKVAAAPAARPWIEAPAKTNGSGIRVRYIVPETVQPGQLTPVQIELSNVQAGAEVQWRLPAGATGTTMPAGADTFMRLTPGQPNVVTVNVVPAADGTVYLDVFTRQNGRSSAQSIPLKVGTGKVTLQQQGTAKPAPGGEKVISLPSSPK